MFRDREKCHQRIVGLSIYDPDDRRLSDSDSAFDTTMYDLSCGFFEAAAAGFLGGLRFNNRAFISPEGSQ